MPIYNLKKACLDKLKEALEELWTDAIEENMDGSGKVNYNIQAAEYELCDSIKTAIHIYEKTKER